MLGDEEAAAEREAEPLHLLHESKQARQLAGEHDVLLPARARAREREHADRFGDHVHDGERLVLGRGVGAYLAEVRGGGGRRQIANRAAGDVANAEIDAPQVALARQFLQPLDRRDPEHVLGESEQRATADAGAAEVLYLVARDGHDRGAGAERDDHRAVEIGERGAADSDRSELIDLDHRPAEQRLGEYARARAGRGYAFDVFEPDAEIGDQFAERSRGRGDRVVSLDRYNMQATIFEDDGVGSRAADIDANDHKWCRLLSSPP